MPSALLRACAYPGGCPNLVVSGYCPEHEPIARAVDARRGSAASRGYDRQWQAFRIFVRNRMIALHILPVCGAALPGGPVTTDSACQAAGLLVGANPDGTELSLDHEPPLRAEERLNPRAVCDLLRVQWLCRACHARKTLREQAQ